MYYCRSLILFLFTIPLFNSCQTDHHVIPSPRQELLFDFDWRFHRGVHTDGYSKTLVDSSWRLVDLPHDWSIEDLPGKNTPFDSSAIGGIDYGFLTGGTSWYRKRFTIPKDSIGKIVKIYFEGLYMNADIWINDIHLGNHPYGYTSFEFDLTDYLNFEEENVLAVKVKNEGNTSRWYPGSGIYRHVWLSMTNPIYVPRWGVKVSCAEITPSSAKVYLKRTIINNLKQEQSIEVITKIIAPSGKSVASTVSSYIINPDSSFLFEDSLEVHSPKRWSLSSPDLYKVITEIRTDQGLLDQVAHSFGIRKIGFSTTGFYLNDENILLKGACIHHDNGPLGAAAYDRAEERKIELLKQNGFNAIRCAHNPPSPALLDACDRLGMLVINEAFDVWAEGKRPNDYHLYFEEWWQKDLESMISRDQNHPSVIMWSIGNEIPNKRDSLVIQTSQKLADFVRHLDPTRPVTAGVNNVRSNKDPYFSTLDIAGYNYVTFAPPKGKRLKRDHWRMPNRIICSMESYPRDAFQAWTDVLDNPYLIGDFVWTGIDYLGESSIGWLGYPLEGDFFPWNHAYCGDIDLCGFKRPQSYYRDVLWEHEGGYPISLFVKPPSPIFQLNKERDDWSRWHTPQLLSDWNWQGSEGQIMEIIVYAMDPEVELFLNGQSLGKKENARANEWITTYQVPFQSGTLEAVGYQNNEIVSRYSLSSTNSPHKIHLSPDNSQMTANGQDLIFVTVEIQDSQSIRHPKAEHLINFSIDGPGEIIAVGNSNPMSLESFQQPFRKAYQGRCLVVIKSKRESGKVLLKASSGNLMEGQITIDVID